MLGIALGLELGSNDGTTVGSRDGWWLGERLGPMLGILLGPRLGKEDTIFEGDTDGIVLDSRRDGSTDGKDEGSMHSVEIGSQGISMR